VWVGEHAADGGIGEKRKRRSRSKPAEVGIGREAQANGHKRHQQQHRAERDRNVDAVDGREIDCAALLAGGAHRGNRGGRELLDDRVGMPNRIQYAFATADAYELARRGGQGADCLFGGVSAQTLDDDGAHLVAEPVEAAEPIEHALAPEERVGVVGQLMTVIAQPEPRVGAVVGEVARDDAIVQHTAE